MDPAEPSLDTLRDFFLKLGKALDTIASLSPPEERVSAAGQLRQILLTNSKLISHPVLSELFEELEWNHQAASAQLFNRPPPPKPSLHLLPTLLSLFVGSLSLLSSHAVVHVPRLSLAPRVWFSPDVSIVLVCF